MVALSVRPASPDEIANAARHLLADGVVVFPTETFYGLGCDPRRPLAVARIFSLKGRDPLRPLPLVAGSRRQVELAAPGWEAIQGAAALAEAFWPGPLSLVLPASPVLAPGVAAPDGTVAVRWTSHPAAASLAVAVGFPIVATSANPSGARAVRTADEAARLVADFDLWVLDGGATRGGSPSTIVDLHEGGFRVLRSGALKERELRAILAATSGRGGC